MRQFLTFDEVAANLRVDRDWLVRYRKRLHTTLGFPLPIKGLGPGKWDPRALELWQDKILSEQNPHLVKWMDPAAVAAAEEQERERTEDELLAARSRQIAAGGGRQR